MSELTDQPHDPWGGIWGDETEIVKMSMEWAGRRVVRPTDPKSTARTASELAADTGVMITPDGIGAEAALRIFDEVLVPATRAQDDPMNLAYIPAAPTRASIAFESVTSSANVFAGLWEAGAGAIFAENAALGWLVDLLGWPQDAGGCFVSGGTIGNLSALVAARQAATIRRGGRDQSHRWRLACSAGAHSSVRSAAQVLDAEVVLVEEDSRGHLTGPALRSALRESGDVFAVVASAGTTNTGVVDDFDDLADVCEEFGMWLHVDGAYGGAGLVAPSVRHRFAGIERADSFIVDPHKWLFAPYDCCALLYKDPRQARAAHAQRASYLDVVDREMWNPADLAVHLSRRARGLPFWFSLATYGTDRYRAAVEQTISTAREVAAAIAGSDHLRLLREPELSVVLFERPGWTPEDYATWSRRLAHEGVILCLPTIWNGRTVLRLAFVNPATRADHVIEVLEQTTR
jgi:glutamate/tyrosine decarboxylase-like PLP-dependent enzyme